MNKVLIFLFLLLPFLGWGQSLDTVVDFSLDLSGLDSAAAAEKAAADGRFVILEGLIKDVEIGSGAEPEVLFVLVNGSWIGTTEVRAYACQVRFSGDYWLKRFQSEKNEVSSDQKIPQGSRILIAARVTGFDPVARMSVVEGTDLRILR
jgi:hypothetical protein